MLGTLRMYFWMRRGRKYSTRDVFDCDQISDGRRGAMQHLWIEKGTLPKYIHFFWSIFVFICLIILNIRLTYLPFTSNYAVHPSASPPHYFLIQSNPNAPGLDWIMNPADLSSPFHTLVWITFTKHRRVRQALGALPGSISVRVHFCYARSFTTHIQLTLFDIQGMRQFYILYVYVWMFSVHARAVTTST